MKTYYVYIMSSKNNRILYVGATDDIKRRTFEHKTKKCKTSFSSKYNVDWLVYYEVVKGTSEEAHKREKQLKKWNRAWKMRLIQEGNQDWLDLSQGWNLDIYKD
nr:GIY-YIG nuclease family protein [Nonlabens ulvanivorans]